MNRSTPPSERVPGSDPRVETPASTSPEARLVAVLRELADRLERGERLPEGAARRLDEVLEDIEDELDAEAARAEPTVPWEQVKARLGL